MFGHDPDYYEEGPPLDDMWNYWYIGRERFVFIYTHHHDRDGSFCVEPIREKTVPRRDQEMLLELNSDHLLEVRRYEIYEVMFGPFTRLNKHDYRTKFRVFTGRLHEFTDHLLDNSPKEQASMMLYQLLERQIQAKELWGDGNI